MTSVFIGGSRRLAQLSSSVKDRVDNIINSNFMILIGDANGTDKRVQEYLVGKHYQNVVVFCMAGACRNNVGNWNIRNILANTDEKDFNFYSAKDVQMAMEATYGFMIWDAKSKGTLNNMINLLKMRKKVLVYFAPDKTFHSLRGLLDLTKLLEKCDKESLERFEKKFSISQLLNGEQPELIFA